MTTNDLYEDGELAFADAPELLPVVRRLMRDAWEEGRRGCSCDRPGSTPTLDTNTISARAEAATPGPWHGPHGEFGCVSIGDYGWVCSGGNNAPEYDVDSEQGNADAEFIAHAREDIPALIARIRELEADLAEALPSDAEREFSRS